MTTPAGPKTSKIGGTHKDLPLVTVVTASAGAGKTYALTHRYVEILLSDRIPHNALLNVFAMTFTNNAAAEMKQRILKLLKLIALGDGETLAEMQSIIKESAPTLQAKAARLLDDLFDNYSDFQVRTIDSFMAAVFKSSSLSYGYHPDFGILLTADTLFADAFDAFSREMREGSPQVRLVQRLIRRIEENRTSDDTFLWEPYGKIMEEAKRIYKLGACQPRPLTAIDTASDLTRLRNLLVARASAIESLIRESGLTTNHYFADDLELIRSGDVHAVMERKLKSSAVLKPNNNREKVAFEKWGPQLETEHAKLNELIAKYVLSYAEGYYRPSVEVLEMLKSALRHAETRLGLIPIDQVNKTLADHLGTEDVPEIYFKIGEIIYHYLIDEFQDTSQIQWRNLRPLLEESLSKGGSLFVVGDPKQSIYGFRDADWRIMKQLTDDVVFPSAAREVRRLETNYRSYEKIVEFNKKVFHEIVPAQGYDKEAAEGGLSTYEQHVKSDYKGKGYVEVEIFQREEDRTPEKEKILAIVEECHSRGYRYAEIAILTPNNDNVIEASAWLNERGIPFISHSTLDVRRRKSAGEFIALLRFLDSPVDDLSFATFILGDAFTAACRKQNGSLSRAAIERLLFEERQHPARPLYAAFRERFSRSWEENFEHLMNIVGYLPLYDLLSESFKTFDVFQCLPEEEAALVKLLEAVKMFEGEGTNSIKEFLEFSEVEADDEIWKISVPPNIDALQVMTVHKAKGIQFPVVIVLFYQANMRWSGSVVEERDGSAGLLRVSKEMAEKVTRLEKLMGQAQFRERIDLLNRLYVALTRAEKEMYIVGIKKKDDEEPTRFLPAQGYGRAEKPSVTPGSMKTATFVEPCHHTARKAVAVHSDESLASDERKRGDLIHRILSAIEYLADDTGVQISQVVERACAEARFEVPNRNLEEAIQKFLSDPTVRECFARKEGRIVLREQELTNRYGALFRADRIVVDTLSATVIDFKTGGDEDEPEYLDQVSNYMFITREIYPERKVSGLIAYVDLVKTTRLE